MSTVPLQAKAELLLRTAGIMPTVTVESVEEARKTVNALVAGGLSVIELNCRTSAAMEALAQLKKEISGIFLGAGAILNEEQIAAAVDAGADFLTTPATPAILADTLATVSLPSIPGATTPTELLNLIGRGYRICKLFPATALGGPTVIQELSAFLPDVKLCVEGGITEDNAPGYLALDNVLCAAGNWMVPRRWLADGDWNKITKSASKAATMIGQAREKRSGGGLLRWR